MKNIQFNSIFANEINRFVQIRALSLKERTIIINQRQLKSFDSYLVTHDIYEITKDAIDGWISALEGSESTVSHAVCTIRLFTEYLTNTGIKAYIPSIPKVHDNYIPYIFNDEEVTRIIKLADSYPSRWNNTIPHMQTELPVIIRISLGCGLRISEIVSLKLKNVNFNDGILTVENGKNNKPRFVPMHESLTELLMKYCLVADIAEDPETWIFPGRDAASHVDSEKIYFRFALILKRAGILVSKEKYERGPCFHCLRHLFVLKSFKQLETQGFSPDYSVPYLSVYLGHNSLKETERYMRFNTGMFLDEFQKFASFSDGVFPEVCYEE